MAIRTPTRKSRLGIALLALTLVVGLSVGTDAVRGQSPDAPRITVVDVQWGGILLHWAKPTSPQPVIGYAIRRSETGKGGDFEMVVNDTGNTNTRYLDALSGASISQLDSGSAWVYQVRAIFGDGDGARSPGSWSEQFTIKLPTFPRPTDVHASSSFVYGGDFELLWRAPTLSWSSSALPHTGYAIIRSSFSGFNPDAGDITVVATAGLSARSFSEPLPRGGKTAYTIRATYGVFFSQHIGWIVPR